jgi:pimeloyl-ACP methyl ester carboxylesterase
MDVSADGLAPRRNLSARGGRTGFLRFDGRRVAYATVGDGPVLLFPAWWVSHVSEDWQGRAQSDAFRSFVETLATKYRVVRYDRIGTGLSDRERPASTLTLEYEVELLEALVDHLSESPVTLFGISCGGCASVAYVVRKPARIDRLVLYGSYACGLELAPPEARDALVGLVRSAWGVGSRALTDIFAPSMSPSDRMPSSPTSARRRRLAPRPTCSSSRTSTTCETFCPTSGFRRWSFTGQATARFRFRPVASSRRSFAARSSSFSTAMRTFPGMAPPGTCWLRLRSFSAFLLSPGGRRTRAGSTS